MVSVSDSDLHVTVDSSFFYLPIPLLQANLNALTSKPADPADVPENRELMIAGKFERQRSLYEEHLANNVVFRNTQSQALFGQSQAVQPGQQHQPSLREVHQQAGFNEQPDQQRVPPVSGGKYDALTILVHDKDDVHQSESARPASSGLPQRTPHLEQQLQRQQLFEEHLRQQREQREMRDVNRQLADDKQKPGTFATEKLSYDDKTHTISGLHTGQQKLHGQPLQHPPDHKQHGLDQLREQVQHVREQVQLKPKEDLPSSLKYPKKEMLLDTGSSHFHSGQPYAQLKPGITAGMEHQPQQKQQLEKNEYFVSDAGLAAIGIRPHSRRASAVGVQGSLQSLTPPHKHFISIEYPVADAILSSTAVKIRGSMSSR
jgi:hypothetical protein